MKEIKSIKKKGALKKIFAKLCRILGFELVDQSTLALPASKSNDIYQLSTPGKKSITLGLGETAITRKVKEIDIIIKTCTSVQLVTQKKKRVFEHEKSEYTFRTINSLIKAAFELQKKFPKIDINFTIIDMGSINTDINKIKSIFSNKFKAKFIFLDPNNLKILPKVIKRENNEIEKNMSTTMASIYESLVEASKSKDLVYFVEDDYIHKEDSLVEMVFAYEKISSIFKRELFLLSTDYPYLYKKFDNTNIIFGEKYHWRTVQESLLTFLTSYQMIEKYLTKLKEMAKNESSPFEKNLHEIYENEICLSPIPSLSVHCSNINSAFGISPNINIHKLWSENEV